MRRAPAALASLALVLFCASAAAADPRVHVVAAGDTLGALAARYRVSVEELRRWNELVDDTIRVGQPLTVEDAPTIRYRTVPGDTLSCIASRHGVTLERLREDNPHLGRRLEAGTRLRIVGGRDPRADDAARTTPLHHRVAAGENPTRIAERYGTTLEALRALNPGLGDRVRVGRSLVVGRAAVSESVGVAWCGHIAGARPLGEHPAYVLRNPARSWATARTIERLRRGFDAVRRRDPRAPRVRVHDLSLEGGGPIDDHRSHQSGRDVDITYYRRSGCDVEGGCPLETIADPADLDARRQWTLFHAWLRSGEAEAIYVDYALQGALHREARRRGATAAQLARWFQYPRGPRHADGVVRHFPNHRDHLHVRFSCARGEPRCR